MNLQDEVVIKYTSMPDKDKLLARASEVLKASSAEKAYCEALVCAAAAFLCDKNQFFEGKPLLLKILEISNKLFLMAPKNTEYKEQYSLYLMMSLASYAEMLNHELLPLTLFKQIPLKSIQLQVLAQPKLHSDWTHQELQNLLVDLAKDISLKEAELLDLARINLIMRYCRSSAMDKTALEKAKEQLKLLLANKPSVAIVARDFINYLKTESSPQELETVTTLLLSEKDKAISAFYQHCQVRALMAFQRHQEQEDCNFYISFSTGGDPILKQLIVNSVVATSPVEKNLPASSATQSPENKLSSTPAPTRVPPPIPSSPPSAAEGKVPPAPPPRRLKPEGKAKTMSKKAGAELMKALRQHSGYAAESPLSEKSATKQPAAKPAEKEKKPIQQQAAISAPSLLELMASAMQSRRDVMKNDDSSDDEEIWHSDDEDSPATAAASKDSESAASQARPLPIPSSQPAAAPLKAQPRNASRPAIFDAGFFAAPPSTDTSAKPAAAPSGPGRKK